MSFSLVIALETFVGEKERKSLEPLLSTPLTNSQLYVGKVLSALIPPMITSYLGITVYLIGLSVAAKWTIPTELFIQILLLSTLQGIIMVAAAVIVSSQTTSVRAANLLASFIIVPIALLLQLEAIVLFWGNSRPLVAHLSSRGHRHNLHPHGHQDFQSRGPFGSGHRYFTR